MTPEKNLLDRLELHRLGDGKEAGLWITSLPCPRGGMPKRSLGGRPTAVFPLGKWPGETNPRRHLLIAQAGGGPPELLRLQDAVEAGSNQPPTAASVLFEENQPGEFVWQRHFLSVTWGGRTFGLALGLRTKGEVHWWEACRLVVRDRSEECLTIEMAGAIPVELLTQELFASNPGYSHPHLHKHNWLSGSVFARLHANGVCEVYAHHINNRYVNEGGGFEDVVPVVGFRTEASAPVGWNRTGEFSLDDIRLDLSEAARLGKPSQPEAFSRDGGFLVWQPYEGVELFGGDYPQAVKGDPFLIRASEKVFPKGMARTLRFSFSLAPETSPRVVRFLAPAWWYGLCEEFQPAALLPVRGDLDAKIDAASEWVRKLVVRGGFEDGSVPRHTKNPREIDGVVHYEAGWDGDVGYGQFIGAWRSGLADDFEMALRSAYLFTDVVIDHALKIGRMHGFPPGAASIVMTRVQGTLMGYLETGDPYLLETTRAVLAATHAVHKNSWPRLAVGRDASYLRAMVLHYRYFGEAYYRTMAEELIDDIVESQLPDGSFGDQGGGSGLHAWAAYIVKPWMGLLALNGVLDYLELIPDHSRARECVRRFADWLLTERWEHDGILTWSYQHYYNQTRSFILPTKIQQLPTSDRWHHETIVRLLGFASIEFGEARYLQAWAESESNTEGGHAVSAILQFLPWLQARLWNARYQDGAIVISPIFFGPKTPRTVSIDSPLGPVEVSWDEQDRPKTPGVVQVQKIQRLS